MKQRVLLYNIPEFNPVTAVSKLCRVRRGE
jgi:hypothetical protein